MAQEPNSALLFFGNVSATVAHLKVCWVSPTFARRLLLQPPFPHAKSGSSNPDRSPNESMFQPLGPDTNRNPFSLPAGMPCESSSSLTKSRNWGRS